MLGAGLGATVAAGAVAGIAGSIVSQGVGLASGIQSKFNWGAVAEGAIGGAIGAGIGGSPGGLNLFAASGSLPTDLDSFGVGFLQGAVGSAAAQGIDVATGLQSKFDWAGVAAAGVGGGVTGAVDANSEALLGVAPGSTEAAVAGGFAGAIANAATRTALGSGNFGDNLAAAIPDAIGQTIGAAYEDSINSQPAGSSTGKGGSDESVDDMINKYAAEYEAEGSTAGNSAQETSAYSGSSPVVVTVMGPPPGSWTSEDTTGAMIAPPEPIEVASLPPVPGYNMWGEPYTPGWTGGPAYANTWDNQLSIGFGNAVAGDLTNIYHGVVSAVSNPVQTVEGVVSAIGVALAHPVDTAIVLSNGLAANVQAFANNYNTAVQNGTLPQFAGSVLGHAAIFGVTLATDTEELDGVEAAAVATDAGAIDDVAAVASGLRPSAVISVERATQLLVDGGIDSDTAEAYINSFDGPISVRLVQPQEQFLRYTDYPDSAGRFLTNTEFENPAAAVEGLALGPYNNTASLVQTVTAVNPTLVLEGGIAGGGAGIQQTLIVDRSAFEFGTGVEYGQ